MKRVLPILAVCFMLAQTAIAQDNKAVEQDISRISRELAALKSNYPNLVSMDIERRKKQLIYTAEFVRAACRSFNAIDAQLDQSTLLQEIADLNNPSNTDLGFSLESILETLIKSHIEKNVGKKEGGKIINTVNGILDNPITKVVGGSVPGLGSVMGFLSNVGFTHRKVTQDDLNGLFDEFKDYLEYYQQLHESNLEFKSGLNDIRVRKRALFKTLQNYAFERSRTLYGADDDTTKYSLLLTDMINEHYNMDKVSKYLADMPEEASTVNNPQLAYSPYLISQARYMTDELEALYNQHLMTHEDYFNSVKRALEKSKTLEGASVEKVKAKIASLKEIQEDWRRTFRLLVDLTAVESKFDKLLGEELN